MKTGNRLIGLLLAVIMLTACIGPLPVLASDTLTGTRLDARSYTQMPLEGSNTEMEKLNDGGMDGAVVVSLSKDINMSDGGYYVDIVFNGYIATVQSLDLGCNTGLVEQQGIIKIGVAAYDDAAKTWGSADQTYDINWLKDGDAYTGKAIVTLDQPLTTSRLRVSILDANRFWDNFRMEELAAYGELTGRKIKNLAANATVTANLESEGGKPLTTLTDSDFASELIFQKQVSAEEPGIITMDFGSQFYDLTEMDLVSLFAKDAGIKAMTIEYKQDGEWTALQDVSFTRPNGHGSTASEIDRIELGITTNAVRFQITGNYTAFGHFRLSELALYGTVAEEPVEPPLPDSMLGAVYMTSMDLDPGYSDLSRLNNQSGYANEPVVVNVKKDAVMGRDYFIDVIFNGKTAQVQSIKLECFQQFFAQQSIKVIDVDWYDGASGTWKPALSDHTVAWRQSASPEGLAKAIIPLPGVVTTTRIRVYIKDANREWDNVRIEEMAVYGAVSDEATSNIARDAALTVGYAFDTQYYAAKDLVDGDYATKLTSEAGVQPSQENPADITFDFGSQYYRIDSLELATAYARYCSVTGADLQYLEYGEWKTLKPLTFTRGQIASSQDYEIDSVPVDVVTNGLRLRIHSAILDQTYHNFSINEMTLTGEQTTAPQQPKPVELIPQPGYEALVDGNGQSVWTSPHAQVPTEAAPQDILLHFTRGFSPKHVQLMSAGIPPTSAIIGYADASGTFVALTQNLPLHFQDGAASILIETVVETENLVIRVTGAPQANYTLSEVSLKGFDRYETVISAIETFESSKLYRDYTAAVQAVGLVSDPAVKAAFEQQIADAKVAAVAAQKIDVFYRVFEKSAELTGHLFAPAGTNINLLIKKDSTEMTAVAVVDADGTFSVTADLKGVTEYGDYTVSTVVDGVKVSTVFDLRVPKTGTQMLKFSIDGITGTINGSGISVALPKGSTPVDRVPVYTLSDGASAFAGATPIESGKSKLDFSAPVTLTIRAENGDTAEYTVRVTVGQGGSDKPSGGGGGGGGGGILPGKNGEIVLAQPSASPAPDETFTDVPRSHWAYESIEALRKAGIVNGIDGNHFEPDSPVKREEFVKMLVCTLDMTAGDTAEFKDTAGHWSEPYIAAAVENGLVMGLSDTEFGVGINITRQDLAVMVYRALPQEQEAQSKGDNALFADDAEIADYTRDAVYALRELRILNGFENRFEPEQYASRAEAAKILSGVKNEEAIL